MKLKIENNDLTVTVEATRELSFEEIFKSHQLVTGREEKHTFVPEDSGTTNEDSNTDPKSGFKKRGEKDANGFYYKANREFISHAPENSEDDFSKMFTRSDDPEKPDAYGTIPDIKKYLDKHGIDYSHAKFKGDYVALIPDD
jgi:hypothetical protein